MLTTATGAALASTNGVQAHAAPAPVNASGNILPITDAPAVMSECTQFRVCLWKNANFGDPFWSADFFSEPSNTWLPVGSALNNAASSVDNFRDVSTEFAQFANGTGLTWCLPANSFVPNLAGSVWPNSTTPINDSITSYRFDTTNQCHL
jgi:hypothetical protein